MTPRCVVCRDDFIFYCEVNIQNPGYLNPVTASAVVATDDDEDELQPPQVMSTDEDSDDNDDVVFEPAVGGFLRQLLNADR